MSELVNPVLALLGGLLLVLSLSSGWIKNRWFISEPTRVQEDQIRRCLGDRQHGDLGVHPGAWNHSAPLTRLFRRSSASQEFQNSN